MSDRQPPLRLRRFIYCKSWPPGRWISQFHSLAVASGKAVVSASNVPGSWCFDAQENMRGAHLQKRVSMPSPEQPSSDGKLPSSDGSFPSSDGRLPSGNGSRTALMELDPD